MNDLPILKHNGQRILTTQQLAEVYETTVDNIKMNFNRNNKNFEEGKHYYLLKGEELRNFKSQVTDSYLPLEINKFASSLYLWTERGANRHCKILDTDKAWEQFDNLEETYFKVKDKELSGEALIALAVVEAQKILSKKDKEIEMKNQVINELKPKADYTDTILRSKALVNINQIAKDYGMSAREMNKILAERCVQYKQGNQWLLYRKYHDKGYTSSETVSITHSDGSPDVIMRIKWTQKGRLFIYELLKKSDILPIIERNLNAV